MSGDAVTAVIVGAGHRAMLYASYAQAHPDELKIVGVADPVGKGLVGRDAGAAIGIDPVGIHVEPRLENALQDADTLILGYVDQLARIRKRDLLRESIRMALEKP